MLFFIYAEFFLTLTKFFKWKGMIHTPPHPHFLQLKKDRETDFGKLMDNIQQFAKCLLIF